MRNLVFIGAIALALVFTGCLKEDNTPTQYSDIGTIVSSVSGVKIKTDNNKILYSNYVPASYDLVVGTRVIVYYSLVQEDPLAVSYNYLIAINDINNIKTKFVQIVNDVSRDTLVNNGLSLSSTWLSDNYLNVDFVFYGQSKVHFVNLVYDILDQTEEGFVVLKLLHDSNDDSYFTQYRGLISFDLSNFSFEGTPPHKIKMKYKTYDGIIKEIIFEYAPPSEN